jgi:hypothetical protein
MRFLFFFILGKIRNNHLPSQVVFPLSHDTEININQGKKQKELYRLKEFGLQPLYKLKPFSRLTAIRQAQNVLSGSPQSSLTNSN